MRIALTIAGSDSGGGAGIQADLKTFHQFGVFGTSAITAVTAQNTLGVTAWEAVSPALVRAQIDAVVLDLRPAAFKSGMLANAAITASVAEAIEDHALRGFVLDPVMVATSGDPLLEPDAIDAIRTRLVPHAALVTPNADEAVLLTGRKIHDMDGARRAAEQLVNELGAAAALVKGGHLATGDVHDVLYDGSHHVITHPRVATSSTHGTGCTLSAAVAAGLALGRPLREAVETAVKFVHAALESAPGLGGGHGPVNHFTRP